MNTWNHPLIRNALLLTALAALLLVQTGCSEDSAVAPDDPAAVTEAPALPDPQLLNVDLGFFADGKAADGQKSQSHFFNAYLRAVIVTAFTQLVLAPPVEAFSIALHTPPSLQDDGSWIWVYTHVDGQAEVQIRLRGLPLDDRVQWSLRVSDNDPAHPLDNVLWFDGETSDEARTGAWTFYDFRLEDAPAVAEVRWGEDERGNYLVLECLAGEDTGKSLTYLEDGPLNAIEYREPEQEGPWFIRWNEDDGSGSLQVPDYNYGEQACWDTQQQDTDCR